MSEEKKSNFGPQEKEKLLQWLASKWVGDKRRCDVCDKMQWSLSDNLVVPMSFVSGGIALGSGQSYPQAMLICTNCGNTKYFNAVISGIVEGKKDGQK